MKTSLNRLTGTALLSIALVSPAFGGRMIDFAAPAAALRETAEETPAPEAELAETEDDNGLADDAEMESERAEDSDPDLEAATEAVTPARRWKFTQSYSLGISYDDNIFIGSSQKVADLIFQLGADYTLLWGDYVKKEDSFLSVHYAPSVILFTDHSDENGFQQDGAIAGQWRIAKLTLGAEARVQSLTGGDSDVGARAERTLYEIALTSKYAYSEKTSFEVNFSRNTSSYRSYLDSTEWINQDWVDYRLFAKTRVGVGLTLGYLDPQGGDPQTYQQALVRLSLPASGKLTVSASGGVEFRQLGGGAGTTTKPVFRIGASYLPFDGTEVSVEASRSTASSAAQVGQNYTATGVSAMIRQRVRQRFYVTLAGGYEDAQYEAAESGIATSRHDQYLFVRPGVSVALMKRVNLELYYQFRRNTSTLETSSFDNNVIGMQATITF